MQHVTRTDMQFIVWLRYTELIEEHLGHVIVNVARVNDDLLHMFPQGAAKHTGLNKLRSGPYDRRNFQEHPSLAYVGSIFDAAQACL